MDYYPNITFIPRIQENLCEFYPIFLMDYHTLEYWIEKTQGINLAKSTKYELECKICGFTSLIVLRQYRDFTKIMIKYKDFKQYQIQPDQSFFPNPRQSQLSQYQIPWEGETQSLNRTSPHPKHPIGREEDSSGVLTVPPNLFKKELERLNEELVKKPRLPFNYWQLKNWKFP